MDTLVFEDFMSVANDPDVDLQMQVFFANDDGARVPLKLTYEYNGDEPVMVLRENK